MQEEGKKTDLLKNDFEDLDIGSFKIKKKKKVVDPMEGLKKKGDNSNLDFLNKNVKYLKVDEMNVIKVSFFQFFKISNFSLGVDNFQVYNDIIEESSADDKYFQVVRSIISIANRSLVNFDFFFAQFLFQ